MYMTTNYLDMEEKLALAQAKVKNLSVENASFLTFFCVVLVMNCLYVFF